MPEIPDPRFEGGLWCNEVLEHLDAYVAGQADDETRRAIEAHVTACDHCASFGGAYAQVVRELHAKLAQPAPLGRDRAQRLSDRLTRVLEDG